MALRWKIDHFEKMDDRLWLGTRCSIYYLDLGIFPSSSNSILDSKNHRQAG